MIILKYIIDRFLFNKIINFIFEEVKEECFICFNNKEYFVVKNVVIIDDKLKVVIVKFKEVKLGKIDVNIEDYGL